MIRRAPHVIPYQGSKRKLAANILTFMNFDIECFYEPFAGSAAITLAAAANNKAKHYVISDKLETLSDLWEMIIHHPQKLIEEYYALWHGQLTDPAEFYKQVRDGYNKTQSPSALLYLVARCVKNAVRFNNEGEFNQGPDNRRLGLKPEKLMKEVHAVSKMLKHKTDIKRGDFRKVLKSCTANDCVYMDPPWQGTSGKRDQRYAHILNMDELIEGLDSLNERNIPFLLSFDGTCGDRTYGSELPGELRLVKVSLNAGRSSQATLLGRDEVTIESLYLSPALAKKNKTKAEIKHSQKELFESI